jgi:feruloyl esterase
MPCAALALQDFTAVPGAPAAVASAVVVPAAQGVPEYCDVHGYIPPQVQFELKLPTKTYQGRYLQQGCGGFCGAIPQTAFPACDAQLGGDFAMAADDEGHVGANAFDGLWGLNDPQLRIDYGFRSEHVLAIAAKAIVARFYGRPPAFSYFDGCSDGGREALDEAQRYPADFDGIVAGAPVYLISEITELDVWAADVALDPQGALLIPAAKLSLLHGAVLAACDGADGLVDGQIDDPRDCRFDPASIACPAGMDRPDCLTAQQADIARQLYQGPVDAQGRHYYTGGFPFGSELAWAGIIPLEPIIANNWLKYLGFPHNPPAGFTFRDFHFTPEDFQRLVQLAGLYDAKNPDLRAFRAHGGKLIIWQGWADQLVVPSATPAYYDEVVDGMGGLRSVQTFARLFMVPGVYHCGGGYVPYQTDFFAPVVAWVEQGTPPDRVIATATLAGGATRTRPVFPYPARAAYSGSGSIDDAASFVPVMPNPAPDDDVRWIGAPPERGSE